MFFFWSDSDKDKGPPVTKVDYGKLGDLFKDIDGGDDLADFSVFTPDVQVAAVSAEVS